MNRFYAAATDVLVRTDAFIDKLVGDQVMAVFLPIFAGADYAALGVIGADGSLTGLVNTTFSVTVYALVLVILLWPLIRKLTRKQEPTDREREPVG